MVINNFMMTRSYYRAAHYIQIILALLVCVGFPAVGKATDESGLYQALHYISCQQYTEDRKQPPHTGRNAADEIYISGWLSAYNYLVANTYDITPNHDVNVVMGWMDKFCVDNPTKGVEAGLLQFTSAAYPTRMQRYVAPVKPR